MLYNFIVSYYTMLYYFLVSVCTQQKIAAHIQKKYQAIKNDRVYDTDPATCRRGRQDKIAVAKERIRLHSH